MSRLMRIAGILAVALFMMPAAVADEFTGNVNFLIGQKMLKSSDWAPLEDQFAFGAEMSWGMSEWPVYVATDVIGSSDEMDITGGLTLEARTSEVDLGVRKFWDADRIHPYLGGGLAIIYADARLRVGGLRISDDDTGAGFWAGGGVTWRLGSRFNIGVSARYSNAGVTIAGVDADAGGFTAGLLLGWGWPEAR